MITVLLVNLVGVTIYVAGVGMCMRAARRTGNHGYLLVAAYFAAALVVGSLNQVREFERGPVAPEELYAPPELTEPANQKDEVVDGNKKSVQAPEKEKETETAVAADGDAKAGKSAETAKKEAQEQGEPPAAAKGPSVDERNLLTVSPPILPALLLAGVFLISRDDPRKRECEAEAEEAPPAEEEGKPEDA